MGGISDLRREKRSMRKSTVAATFAMGIVMLFLSNLYAQEQSPGTSQQASEVQQQNNAVPQQGGWYCPWMSLRTQGSGGWCCPWAGGGGGPHHRGRGRMAQYAPQPGKQLTQEQTRTLLQDYLKATNNPNLKLGSVADKGNFYEAEIMTQNGSLADKIQVNKDTGWFRSAY